MKRLTFIITLIAIIAGIGVVYNGLFNPLVGLFFGLILISPLYVTLVMSKFLSGAGTQITLLCSTAFYLPYLIYLFSFRLGPEGHFDFMALMYAAPVMIVLWFVAGTLSQTRAEQVMDGNPH
jgi:hypothetical protein